MKRINIRLFVGLAALIATLTVGIAYACNGNAPTRAALTSQTCEEEDAAAQQAEGDSSDTNDCIPPTPKPCQYNAQIVATNPACVAPKPTPKPKTVTTDVGGVTEVSPAPAPQAVVEQIEAQYQGK